MKRMKFIKGFVVTIVVYVGLSLVFQILPGLLGFGGISIAELFASMGSISGLFVTYLASPVVTSTITSLLVYLVDLTAFQYLLAMLASILPVALAAILGSLAEKKSGTVGTIFGSAFAGLLVCAGVGILLFVLDIMGAGTITDPVFRAMIWFIEVSMIMGAINAFIWCSIGLFATSKVWA